MYGKWNGYMSIACNVKLLVCGSVSLCGDFVLLAGPDPAYIFLGWLQALHISQARWLAFKSLILHTEEYTGIFICMYLRI